MTKLSKLIHSIEHYFLSDNPEEITLYDRLWFYTPYTLATLIALSVTL